MSLSFQKLFYAISTLIAFFAILILGKIVLIPLAMALLVSFILFPIVKKLERSGVNQIIAAMLSILLVFVILAGGILFFSTQIINLSQNFTDFQDKIFLLFKDSIDYLNKHVKIIPTLESETLLNQFKDFLQKSAGAFAGQTINSTSTILAQFGATIIYTFLILIYRKGFTEAFLLFFPETEKERVLKMLKNIQQVGQRYLSGVITLILILGLANSLGLMIIGIDSPFLFGFLAAVMSIVPYIGTTLGAFIPVLYALMTFDSIWVPVAVAIMFWSVQLVESNFLSPRVVGSSVKVNALAAILSLIIGASVWGVFGMILFLPFVAMFKVVCEEFKELRPIALLIGTQNDTSQTFNIEILGKWFQKMKNYLAKYRKPSEK